MTINKIWHEENPMPKKITPEQKLQWHVNHFRECGCREIPDKIKQLMKLRKPKIIVGVLAKNGNKYLLAREKLESGRDRWLVPGGKVEFGESLEDAAKRELQEETGIKADKLKFLCFKEALFPEYNYHTVIFFYSTETKQTKLSKDTDGKVQESKWFTLNEAKKLPLVESAEWLFKTFDKKI